MKHVTDKYPFAGPQRLNEALASACGTPHSRGPRRSNLGHLGCLLALPAIFVLTTVANAATRAKAECRGGDFTGGAKAQVGSAFYGREAVNVVYSQATGNASSMTASVVLDRVPAKPLFLFLEAMDDDAPTRCRIQIKINSHDLAAGPSQFPDGRWKTVRFALPEGTLRPGTNTVQIINREANGPVGTPPWFMVARAAIAPENYEMPQVQSSSYAVRLPRKARPIPEPLARGEEPGFKFRGTKGWAWTPEQYLAEIPYLAKFKMNFFMNCYISMFDTENHVWTNGEANRWYEDLPETKKKAYEKVVRACQANGIEFCFSMNPNLISKRLVNDGAPDSVDLLYKHYAWMQSLGVKWFNISLDDAAQGVNPSTQAKVVNEVFQRLRVKDPRAQMIFCPTFYWDDGTATNQMNWGQDQQPYLETLARELHPDVYLFWTGDAVVGKISRRAAESFKRLSGHRLFLWDNYPVNDDQPTMHLGPIRGREAGLAAVIDGYMSNPMCKQNELNRLPLATCADYAYNPDAYDPDRSIGQSILLLGKTKGQRQVLKELVETYPGFLVTGGGPGTNPVRDQYLRLLKDTDGADAATAFLKRIEALHLRLQKEFPNTFAAAKKTLENDLTWMKGQR